MFADQIARQLHKGQRYGEYDYFSEHVQDVANRVARQTSGSTFTAIAYLHDVVEDCGITLEQLGGMLSKDIYDVATILSAVDALTKREGEDYTAYMSRVMQNKHAAFVKYYDSESNMYSCILDGDAKRAQKYLKNMCMLKNFV